MTEKAELSHAEQNAKGWSETISEWIACLNADRDRLEELRDERDNWEPGPADGLDSSDPANAPSWEDNNPEDAEELAELIAAVTIEGEETDEESVRQRIEEAPLTVMVRGGWHSPGETEEAPEEYEILLSTGGPALRIIGDLDQHCQPTRAVLQHQDWGTPWTDCFGHIEHNTLLQFAQCFYFGQ